MTRAEIIAKFRAENPEITTRVITDSTLAVWCLDADKEICIETRCIVSNESETFLATANLQFYDLEAKISKFYEIDDLPGGGVYYDNSWLKKITPGEMNYIERNWKVRVSGTPQWYWRRGKHLWFDRAPDSSTKEIAVDVVFIPNDFDADNKTPYNQLGHLVAFHDAISKYLQFRAKGTVGKEGEGDKAFKEYFRYTQWMKKVVKGYNQGPTYLRPRVYASGYHALRKS